MTGLSVGDRVMGMVPGGLADTALVDERYLSVVPADWDDETAASVPLVFLTACTPSVISPVCRRGSGC
nr:hypothetical protein [Streptomyces sp. DHE17-7]